MTTKTDKEVDIGLIGLAVMGENLALNIESKGFSVAVYNRTSSKTDEFISGKAAGKNIKATYSLRDLVQSLSRPRKVLLMVKAGKPVDDLIDELVPLLDPDDMIIDGGNSHYTDTERRARQVEGCGLLYVGTGVSGGEEGALKGPSIMPGGTPAAWERIRPILDAVAAKVADGSPCCAWVGRGGAGHFVKMVHNGIEYGDMQLICESYQVMRALLGMTPDEIHAVFKRWNRGELESYLIEITADILTVRDQDGAPLVDKILDRAGQKGTGKWTVSAALDLGVPLPLTAESVFARYLSSLKNERVAASSLLSGPSLSFQGDRQAFVDDLEQALYASKIISYAQGFALMRAASAEYKWELDYGQIALLWRAGCIIRSVFLDKISAAFRDDAQLSSLILAPFFRERIQRTQAGWRRVVAAAVTHGIPIPAFTAALCFYDGYRSHTLPANLLQAQRDYFGAHTYERVDRPRSEFFHTDWIAAKS
jgi:6-phosphogluconate dehydrogenase